MGRLSIQEKKKGEGENSLEASNSGLHKSLMGSDSVWLAVLLSSAQGKHYMS